MSRPPGENALFKCGYEARCLYQNRVPEKDMLCPDCLKQELNESTNELEAHK
jgi:hypothetical protein